ncbi:gluconokinase [Algimonas arctica]|uniref:Gluconokinase n=1 Tax=Algimonas arctica TaxID=1479486 RepID=A0A8J3G1V8_9PROT|nr:gluconokinase, GntK/IdnK-type [Algimonas arctica]GHA89578.1 gluconokinase [Algimonas arctica]
MSSSLRSLIVIMGVSGCGKSTIGRALAAKNAWPFLEGDRFHPAENIEKMASGTPLTDQDRVAWMDGICCAVDAHAAPVLVLACSALTPFVRNRLGQIGRNLIYAHLKTDSVDMVERLGFRDHFMPAQLLSSQYAALSVPDGAYEFDASKPADRIVVQMMDRFIGGPTDMRPPRWNS